MNRRPPASAPRRGVLGGAVLLAIGAAFFLPPLGVPDAGAYLFIALGLAFAAAWWRGPRPYVYLVPACVLIGFGLGLVIPALLDLPPDTQGPVFLGTLAGGLVAVFLLASSSAYIYWWSHRGRGPLMGKGAPGVGASDGVGALQ